MIFDDDVEYCNNSSGYINNFSHIIVMCSLYLGSGREYIYYEHDALNSHYMPC